MPFQCFVIGERLYYVAVQNLMHRCRNVHLTPIDNIEAPVQQFSTKDHPDTFCKSPKWSSSLSKAHSPLSQTPNWTKGARAALRILSTDCIGFGMNHKITENWKFYQNIYYSLICTYGQKLHRQKLQSFQVKSYIVLQGVVLFHRCI